MTLMVVSERARPRHEGRLSGLMEAPFELRERCARPWRISLQSRARPATTSHDGQNAIIIYAESLLL